MDNIHKTLDGLVYIINELKKSYPNNKFKNIVKSFGGNKGKLSYIFNAEIHTKDFQKSDFFFKSGYSRRF